MKWLGVKFFLLGLAAGGAAGLYGFVQGEGFGDVDYRYISFHWRGRSIQIQLSDEVTAR